jgi:hypothetical protein
MFDAKAMFCCFNVCHFPSHYMIGSLPRGAHGIFQSSRTGSSVDFYVVRNILNTLVCFHPFLSLLVHGLLGMSRCALIAFDEQRHIWLSSRILYAPWVESSRIYSSATAPKDTRTNETLPVHTTCRRIGPQLLQLAV